MAGFIKLYKELLDHPVVHKDNDYLAVWIFILTNAEFEPKTEDFNGQTILLEPGQFITGRKKISLKCMVSETKVERILNRFENEHQIEQLKTTHKRLITVLNWSSYQKSGQKSGQQVDNYRTTTGQPVDTVLRIKELKNIRKNTKEGGFTPPTVLEVSDFITEMKYGVDAQRFVSFYASKNWMVGKNKMKDWRSAVTGWNTRDNQKTGRVEPIPDYEPTHTEKVDIDELRERIKLVSK